MKKEIYTIGSSARDWEEFVDILKHFGIKTLVDVRRFPTSKIEHFIKKNLNSKLKSQTIGYLWLGENLGGYRAGGYKEFMKEDLFQEGILKLEKLAHKNKIALMCAERLPWKCHRSYISHQLEKRDWKIVHIIEKEDPRKEEREIKPTCQQKFDLLKPN